jgi:CheY-like chemotaxis protein
VDDTAVLIRAVGSLLWPLVVLVVVLRLLPELRFRLRNSDVKVKIGAAELSLQDVSDTITRQVDDLQDAVQGILRDAPPATSAPAPAAATPPTRVLRGGPAAPPAPAAGTPSPAAAPVPHRRAVAWFGGDPVTSAYELAKLRGQGVTVLEAATPVDAVRLVAAGQADVLVAAVEPGTASAVLREARSAGPATPVIVYGAAVGDDRDRAAFLAEGAAAATASPLELFTTLQRLGISAG